MKQTIRILAVAACLALAGCVTQQQLRSGDCGPEPVAQSANVEKHIADMLRDPSSAQFRGGEWRRGWIKDGLIKGGEVHFGWVYCVEVNGKNGFGGYVGFGRRFIFLENNTGQVVDATGEFRNMFGMMAGFL